MARLSCPHCQTALRASRELLGRALNCPKCRAKLAVIAGAQGALELKRLVEAPAAAPETRDARRQALDQLDIEKTAVPCPACGDRIVASDRFCGSCGEELSGERKHQVEARAWKGAMRNWAAGARKRRVKRLRQRRMLRVATILLCLGLLSLVQGTFHAVVSHRQYERDRANIQMEIAPDDLVELEDGEVLTRAELLQRIQIEHWIDIGIPLSLALLYLALFAWARRAPLPAAVTALCLLLVLHFIAAFLDPSSLYRGLLMKVILAVFLCGGIGAALAERADQAKHAAELADRRRDLPERSGLRSKRARS